MPTLTPVPATTVVDVQHGVRSRDVADLTHSSGYPSISVLLPTEPAPRMTDADAERLDELVREVRRRLTADSVPGTERLMTRLGEQVARVRRQPTDRGLALYVNLAVGRAFRLGRPVLPRAVVEQTFATRDLVQELQRTPPYLLVVLDGTGARMYQSTGGAVRAVGARDLFREAGDPGDADALETFLADVDRMVGTYRERHPSPMVLAGSPQVLDRFTAVSRHLHRLAGRVDPDRAATTAGLFEAAGEQLEDYLRSRRRDALESLGRALADRPRDVARGMADAWSAVHRAQPLMLLVEEGFVSPGPVEAGGHPRSHDLVDDLMELVIMRGGQLALVDDGDLAEHGRIALISRPGRPR